MSEPISLFESPICARHCTVCEGLDHHWLEGFDEEDGQPIWACKHCEQTKPYTGE